MDGWFDIKLDRDDGMMRLTMGGFFEGDAIQRMGAAIVEAVATLGLPPNQHLTLCDITAMNIQTQDMVTMFAAMVANPATRSRRLAFVAAATLARYQAKRLTDRPDVAFFADTPTALDWLVDRRTAAAA